MDVIASRVLKVFGIIFCLIVFFSVQSALASKPVKRCTLLAAQSHHCNQASLKEFFNGEDCNLATRKAFKTLVSSICYHHKGKVVGDYKQQQRRDGVDTWSMACQSQYLENKSFLCTFKVSKQ